MTVHRIDLARLDAAVDHLNAYAKQLTQELSTIDEAVATLGTGWTGPAATAHAKAHGEWSKALSEMTESIKIMRQAADTARGNYTGAAAANMQIWQD